MTNNIETDEEIEINGAGYSCCFNDWALNKNIKNDLGLLMIISSLAATKGYCWVSNEYLAKLFEIDEVSVSRKIKNLEKEGVITIEYKRIGKVIVSRWIRLTKMLTAVNKNVNGTVNKNVKDNNTIYNNIYTENSAPAQIGSLPAENTVDNLSYRDKELRLAYDKFWQTYPVQRRNGGKEKMFDKYKRALIKHKITSEQMLKALISYLKEPSEVKYVKNLTTFLNQETYVNYLTQEADGPSNNASGDYLEKFLH